MSATNDFEEIILSAFNGTTQAASAKIYLSLLLSDPTETGKAGTEVSYVGYKRKQIGFDVPQKDGEDVTIVNLEEIEFALATEAGGTVTHIGVHTSETGGTMLLYIPLQDGERMVITPNYAPVIRKGLAKHRLSGGMSTYFKKAVFNLLRGQNLRGFTPYLGLVNGGIERGGNEFIGQGYSRVAFPMSTPVEQPNGIMLIKNVGNTNFAIAETNWGVWNETVIFDAPTNGNAIYVFKEVGSEIKANDMVKINADDVKVGVN